MTKTELIQKVKSLGLVEYGVYPVCLAEKIEASGTEAVVAALNNADIQGALLQLLDREPQKIFRGMQIVAEGLGTTRMELHVPEYAAAKANTLAQAAKDAGVEIVVGIVNVRANANAFVSHIVTMAEIADAMDGKKIEGIYVSVNGGELQLVRNDLKIKELVGEDVKGVQTGYVLRGTDALEMTVGEANITNGVLNAITTKDCVVDTVQKQLLADRKQSCGKCVFCREGLLQLEAMMKDITIGRGKLDQIDMTKEIGEAMVFSTPCSMGQQSALLPLSAIDVFKGEVEEHIKKKKCAANVCKAFQKVYIDPTGCVGCNTCIQACPENTIDGAEGYIHIVFDNNCTKCGKCIEACPEKVIHLTTGAVPKLPKKMMRVGRFR